MKRKGSLMLEVIIAIGVLSIISMVAFSTCRVLLFSNSKRINSHKMNESVYGIVNDIKYNISYTDLINALKNVNIEKKYGNEFLYNLTTTSLFLCEGKIKEDERLEIELLNRVTYIADKILIIKIRIIYKGEIMEKTITKAPWTEYV